MSTRPARALNLTAKLKDTANTEAPQLSFQRKAVQDFYARQADPPPSSIGATNSNPIAPSSANSGAVLPAQNKDNIPSVIGIDTGEDIESVDQPSLCTSSSFP